MSSLSLTALFMVVDSLVLILISKTRQIRPFRAQSPLDSERVLTEDMKIKENVEIPTEIGVSMGLHVCYVPGIHLFIRQLFLLR